MIGKSDKTTKAEADAPPSEVTRAFLKHNVFLKAFLRRFIHRSHDIDDIAQEAFTRAFKVEQNSGIDHPKTLLFTIAKNIALSELRRKARKVTDYIEECSSPEPVGASVEEEVVALERLEQYCAAVDDLPEQCRRVYLLRKVHGMAHKDIAEQLNITTRSVERHLAKGVLRCSNQLRAQDDASSRQATPVSPLSARKEKV